MTTTDQSATQITTATRPVILARYHPGAAGKTAHEVHMFPLPLRVDTGETRPWPTGVQRIGGTLLLPPPSLPAGQSPGYAHLTRTCRAPSIGR